MTYIIEVRRDGDVCRFTKEADSAAEALCGLGGDAWCQSPDGDWHTTYYDREVGYYVSTR